MNWFKHASPDEYKALVNGHAMVEQDKRRITGQVLLDLVNEVERQRLAAITPAQRHANAVLKAYGLK